MLVTDGLDKLQAGTKVIVQAAASEAAATQATAASATAAQAGAKVTVHRSGQ